MLHVFKSLPVVDEVHRDNRLPARVDTYARDTVTLGWEERLKARGRRRTDAGFEFGTSLPLGTVLQDRDCFVIDDLAVVIHVAERAEPVFVIHPTSSLEWGLFAYQIGNSHQPAMFIDDVIVCPDAAWIEQVLTYHRIPFERAVRPFTPAGRPADHRHQP